MSYSGILVPPPTIVSGDFFVCVVCCCCDFLNGSFAVEANVLMH